MFVLAPLLAGVSVAMNPGYGGNDILYASTTTGADGQESYSCTCGEPCVSPDGRSGQCGADERTCANFFAEPICDNVETTTSSIAGYTDSDYSCTCGEQCVSPEGFFGMCGSDGVTCADFFAPPICEGGDEESTTTTEVFESCTCGEPCALENGALGLCGADGVTCAIFKTAPRCPGKATEEPVTTTGPSQEQCPSGCTGIQSRQPNYFCDDGTLAGPVCLEPECEWVVRSCPDVLATTTTNDLDETSTTSSISTLMADWCPDSPSIAPTCRLPLCPNDCVVDRECAMRAGSCTCDYECVAAVQESSPCADTTCKGTTCSALFAKGISPSKTGCKECGGCECSWWDCEGGMVVDDYGMVPPEYAPMIMDGYGMVERTVPPPPVAN